MSFSFSQSLFLDHQQNIEQIAKTAFVKCIINKEPISLSDYQENDFYYLSFFIDMLNTLQEKANNTEDHNLFRLLMSGIVSDELEERRLTGEQKKGPSNQAFAQYITYLKENILPTENMGIILSAIAPCYWIYAELGKKGFWPHLYQTENYTRECSALYQHLDSLALNANSQNKKRMQEVFATSVQYEWRIFSSLAKDNPYANATLYDTWFISNSNVLQSELLLLKESLERANYSANSKILSIGCGSALFEKLLLDQFNMVVSDGIEPSSPMREIALTRGLNAVAGAAEYLPYADETFDCVYYNGSASYLKNLTIAFTEAKRVLKKGGSLIILDLMVEGSYGLLYKYAYSLGSWDVVKDISPQNPFPLEFLQGGLSKTFAEKLSALQNVGFNSLQFLQTLTTHPKYSNDAIEMVSEGYNRGDYVAIIAQFA